MELGLDPGDAAATRGRAPRLPFPPAARHVPGVGRFHAARSPGIGLDPVT
jgi:hypothetical protein